MSLGLGQDFRWTPEAVNYLRSTAQSVVASLFSTTG